MVEVAHIRLQNIAQHLLVIVRPHCTETLRRVVCLHKLEARSKVINVILLSRCGIDQVASKITSAVNLSHIS